MQLTIAAPLLDAHEPPLPRARTRTGSWAGRRDDRRAERLLAAHGLVVSPSLARARQ